MRRSNQRLHQLELLLVAVRIARLLRVRCLLFGDEVAAPRSHRARLTQLVGLMAAVHFAVGVNLEVEADANPAVEPARPAPRADPPLLQKLAFQRDALRSRGGVNQVSDGQKVKRKVHSSQKGDAG